MGGRIGIIAGSASLENDRFNFGINLNLAPVADNPSIIGTAELVKSKPGIKRGSDYLFHVRNLLETSGIKININETKTTEKFGGVEFDMLEVVLSIGNISIQQKYYSTIMRDYAISFILTYTSEEGHEYLKEILKTVEFE